MTPPPQASRRSPASPAIHLLLRPAPGRRRENRYRLADRILVSPVAIDPLESYRISPPAGDPAPAVALAAAFSSASPDVVETPVAGAVSEVFVAGRLRRAVRRSGAAGHRFELEGLGELSVAADGGRIDGRRLAPGLPEAVRDEVLLGPGLVLALALRGTWCLHASAALSAAGGIVFLGESGRGKSTLAAALEEHGWPRLADDVVALELAPDGAHLLSDFPQLKLPAERQPVRRAPRRCPLRALFLLVDEAEAAAAPRVLDLPPARRLAALVRHSVAARLFDEALLERHLAALGEVVRRVPLHTLSYPRRREALPAVREAVRKVVGVA